jgi:diguanylate cyclase (GGDEF)-like protein
MGTLCIIDRETRDFSDADREALRDLAEMVDSEIAALSLATRDTLTDLSNRRGFEMLAAHALRVALRNRVHVALLYFDLDGFKAINDSFGHRAGDQTLVEFSELLLHAFRDSDVVARIGGDEFCVLLSAIQDNEVHVPLERLAQSVADRNASPVHGFDIRYSVGVVTDAMTEPRPLTELIERADRQMYEAKKKGRSASRGAAAVTQDLKNH